MSLPNPALARCSWLVDCGPGHRVVHRGPWVEEQAGMVAEGAWVGDFSPDGAVRSRFRSGSGAVLGEGSITLFAPTHCVESIYCFVSSDGTGAVASNSLAMVAGYRDDALYAQSQAGPVHSRVNQIIKGFVEYPRELYRTDAGTMYRLAWGVFDVDLSTGDLSERPPFSRRPAPFGDFASYRDYLRFVIADTWRNARDSRRDRPYQHLVSSVSAGYDSACCAALAKAVGGTKTVTLATARGGVADSGRPIAEALGMSCIEIERRASALEESGTTFLDADRLAGPDHDLFLASPMHAGDLVFQPFAEALAGSVFLMGHIGDPLWRPGCTSGPEIKRQDNAGAGLDEFRLHTGFVHLPLPFAGAEHSSVIAAITAGEEMRPYSVGGVYDRPIPRRIVEEAGVTRPAFGQRKSATVAQVRVDHAEQHRALRRLAGTYARAMHGDGIAQPAAAGAG